MHHLGVESMYFRVHFVKAKRNPYNFEVIRVFFFYQHYSLPGKSLEIIPFQIPAYIRLQGGSAKNLVFGRMGIFLAGFLADA